MRSNVSVTTPRTFESKVKIQIHLQGLIKQPPSLHNCWTKLFSGIVIAYETNAQPSRLTQNLMRGIGLPFAAMIQASTARCLIEVNDVQILMGFSTLLIPVAEYSNSVQWHLEMTEGKEINPWELCERIPIKDKATWPCGRPFRELCVKQAYLGTGMMSFVDLGTKKSRSRCGWTSLKDSRRQPALHSFTVGASGGGLAHFGLTGYATFTFGKQVLTQTIEKNYNLILEAAKGQLACIYDASEFRAWLIPTTSLLLEMVYLHVQLKGNYDSDDLPVAGKLLDGDQAAYDALSGKENLLLRRKSRSKYKRFGEAQAEQQEEEKLALPASTSSIPKKLGYLDPVVEVLVAHENPQVVSVQDEQVLNLGGGLSTKSTTYLETIVRTGVESTRKSEDDVKGIDTKSDRYSSQPKAVANYIGMEQNSLRISPHISKQEALEPVTGNYRFADLVDYLYGPIQRAKHQKPQKPMLALGRPSIHGWELMDTVSLDADIRGKHHVLKSSAGRWPDMLEGIPTFFAADTENVIGIVNENLCLDCKSVPKGHDLLAIQSRSLYKLSAKNGHIVPPGQLGSFKVAKSLWWNPSLDPFEDCHASTIMNRNCWTDRLQARLQSRPETSTQKQVGMFHQDGLVVFGKCRELPSVMEEKLRHAKAQTEMEEVMASIASVPISL